MTQDDRLMRLQAIAQMIRDRDMARLQKLAQARTQTSDRAKRLLQTVPLAQDPALFAARQLHAKWAQEQRIRLNRTLALQTARMIEQRDKTARSHGRAEVLTRLCRQKPR